MASNAGIRAARAFVEVFMDDEKLQRGIKRVQRSMRAMAAGITQAGRTLFTGALVAAAPLIGAVTKFASVGDEIDKLSRRTGIGAERLSEYAFALDKNDASLGDFRSGLKNMAGFLQLAEQGGKEQQRTLEALGLTYEDLAGLSQDDRFLLFAERLSMVEDVGRQSALAVDIFRGAGEKLLPTLQLGVEGINALGKEAHETGNIMSQEQAAAAAKLTDAYAKVKDTFTGIVVQIGSALAPAMTELAGVVSRNASGVVTWVQANQSAIRTFAAGVAFVGGLGIAFIGLGASISAAATILGAATATFTTLTAVATGSLGAIAAGIAFLTSPVGLLTAALVVAGAAFIHFSGLGTAALDALKSAFGPLVDEANESFAAIKAALSAGQYQVAARILMLTLKQEFLRGLNALTAELNKFRFGFFTTIDELQAAVETAFAKLEQIRLKGTVTLTELVTPGFDGDAARTAIDRTTEARIDEVESSKRDRQQSAFDELLSSTRDTGLKEELQDLSRRLKDLRENAGKGGTVLTAGDGKVLVNVGDAATPDGLEFKDRLNELVDQLKNGQISQAVSAATSPAPSATQTDGRSESRVRDSRDLRTVDGFREIVSAFNNQGVEKEHLRVSKVTNDLLEELSGNVLRLAEGHSL